MFPSKFLQFPSILTHFHAANEKNQNGGRDLAISRGLVWANIWVSPLWITAVWRITFSVGVNKYHARLRAHLLCKGCFYPVAHRCTYKALWTRDVSWHVVIAGLHHCLYGRSSFQIPSHWSDDIIRSSRRDLAKYRDTSRFNRSRVCDFVRYRGLFQHIGAGHTILSSKLKSPSPQRRYSYRNEFLNHRQ